MRYRLPEALGGGEYHTVPAFGHNREYVRVDVPGVGWVEVPEKAMILVEDPLPPEPPVGSVVLDGKGLAWQHVDVARDRKVWWCTKDVLDETWTELNAQYGPLTLLVPEVTP